MATDNDKKTLDYGAVLADLEAKKAVLERAIASLRAVMDGGALGVNIGESMSMADGFSGSLMPTGEVPHGAFLGKSIPEAAKLYLAIVKRKQTSREIAEGLKKGGIESKSKSFNAQVHSILDRARKSGSGVFVKLDGHWGLAEWYPSALRTSVTTSEKRSRKGRKRLGRPPKGKSVAESGQKGTGAKEHIVQVLKSKPGAEFSAKEIAAPAGVSIQVAALVLGRLAAAKQVEKTATGKYRVMVA